MVYVPKTEIGKTTDALTEQLNSAQLHWNTYPTQVGRGYTTAYKFHQKAIDDINKNLQLSRPTACCRYSASPLPVAWQAA
jgi:hypothetical protein